MIPASRFCPVCNRPRSRHDEYQFCEGWHFTVSRTISLTVNAPTVEDAHAQADAYPATAWNIDNEEITSA